MAPLETPVVPPVYWEGQVVRRHRHRFESRVRAQRQHGVEGHGAGQGKRRHHLLHPPHHEVGEVLLREAEQVADAGDDHMLDRRAADRLLQHVRHVFEDENGDGARIGELVFQFAGEKAD
jgi:hypothetical protein